jgi:hypothetical protein
LANLGIGKHRLGDLVVGMKIWVGLQRDLKFVYERTEVVHDEEEVADVVRDTMLEYADETGESLWNLTIKVDRTPDQGKSEGKANDVETEP